MLAAILHWLDLALVYAAAAALSGGGLYLALIFGRNPLNPLTLFAKPLRWVGVGMVAFGCVLGAYNYGRSVGAAAVEARWKEKNYEAQIARLARDAAVQKLAADLAAQQSQQLTSLNNDLQDKLVAYENAPRGNADCRLPTADDDRRMCALVGAAAPGCQRAK